MNPVVPTEDEAFSPRARLFTAMALAIAADALQLFVLPFFVEGGFSPLDDALDIVVAIIMVTLIGWHWEFLPAFAAELVPGVDMVPFWTFAVMNVYRKSRQVAEHDGRDEGHDEGRVIEGEYKIS